MAAVESGPLTCPKCRRLLSPEEVAQGAPCPSCRAAFETLVFPAMFEGPRRGRSSERLAADDQAACFYHAGRKAEAVCDHCGRFLCATCDLEIFNQHLCPQCVEAARETNQFGRLENQYTRWDKVALSVAVWPIVLGFCFMFWFWIVTAPIAIYICLRYRKERLSLLPVVKWRFGVAFVLAVLQLLFFVGAMIWLRDSMTEALNL